MTTPFVLQLRSRADVVRLAPAGTAALTVRVEMPEVWDVVRVAVAPTTPVRELKRAALAALYAPDEALDAFVLKLRGWDVLDEEATVASTGAVDGSCFLLTHRYRRPVR